MKYKFLILFFLIFNLLTGQEVSHFSLQEAIDYGLTHNNQIKQAQNNLLIAKKKVWETTAMGFPQIDASADYQNFIKQPVQLLPAKIFNPQAPDDTYIPVQFGTDQNMKWQATLKQLIFNGSYLVGLQSSRTFKRITENSLIKTRQKIKEAIVSAYGNALLNDESLHIMQNNISVVEKNLFEVSQMYQNGLVEQTDVEQLQITLANLKNEYDYLKRMKKIAYEMLNYTLGRPVNETIKLSDNLESLKEQSMSLSLLKQDFEPEKNIDFLIAKNQQKAKELQIKYEKSKALPSISAFVNYGKNAYSSSFNFFDGNQAWYEQSLFGISINLPIFSSFARSAKVKQATLAYNNARLTFEATQKELTLKYNQNKAAFEHSFKSYEIAKHNMTLAERIARKEEIKFKEGVGNSFQLNQARLQLYQTQQQYLKSIIDIINNKVALENILGL